MTLTTLAGHAEFDYTGSVNTGTLIRYGHGSTVTVSAIDYANLIQHFRGTTVAIGADRINPPAGSLGAWLRGNVTPTGIASYVAPILIYEGIAKRVNHMTIEFP